MNLHTEQRNPVPSRDLMLLEVNDMTVINFYRNAPGALEALFALQIPQKTLVVGNLNARHHSWQPGADNYQQGADISDWAGRNNLRLINEPGPVASPLRPTKYKITPEEELKRFGELVAQWAPRLPATIETADEVDGLAQALKEMLQATLSASGRKGGKRAIGTPWWTENCTEARAVLLALRRTGDPSEPDIREARRELRRVVRRAKAAFWNRQITEAADAGSMHKVMRWTKSSGQLRAPPLEIESVVYETQRDRAQALRSALLERQNLADDIPGPTEAVQAPRRLDLDCTVTMDDAHHACNFTGNTSPGADEITVAMLKAAWPSISMAVTMLFQASLRLRHYP
ncbi:hypothetical protein HIM_11117 [Hirsutella minnesotensis 3608]|uniref:Endonuclease/exonuclease/phosphatase domain-containing protein n=1 Tax=Hirsutella minnesotensis 3608 TaxID=1043627 RepID=A0A0F7ZJB8_9HYPO|nr:hypothetical protein HIM_11117 [Hirsutella minnesotensis 3608]